MQPFQNNCYLIVLSTVLKYIPLRDIYLPIVQYRYWITEKIKDLPERDMDDSGSKYNYNGGFDFATVVVPATWIERCNYKLSWNNDEMKSFQQSTSTFLNVTLFTFMQILLRFRF